MLHQNKYFYIKYHSWAWSLNICVSMYIQYIYISKAKLENSGDMSAAEFCIIDRKKCVFQNPKIVSQLQPLWPLVLPNQPSPFFRWKSDRTGGVQIRLARTNPRNVVKVPRVTHKSHEQMATKSQSQGLRRFMAHMYTHLKTQIPRHVETSQKTQVDDLPWIYTKKPPPPSELMFFGISKLLPGTSWVFFRTGPFYKSCFPIFKGKQLEFFQLFRLP